MLRFALAATALLFSFGVAVQTALVMLRAPGGIDWELFTRVGSAVASGQNPYAVVHEGIQFRWSPVMAWVFALLAPIGLYGWYVLHFAALALLRPWWLAVLVGTSWPFWDDLHGGNAMIFSAVAAYYAVRGNRVGEWAYLLNCLLIPRPLFLPVLGWLLWKRPRTRLPFVGLAVAHLLVVLVIGWGDEWIPRLLTSAGDIDNPWNFAPSRFIGWAWVPIGLALAAWLTWKGRLGLASLAASPYIFPFYALMLTGEHLGKRKGQ